MLEHNNVWNTYQPKTNRFSNFEWKWRYLVPVWGTAIAAKDLVLDEISTTKAQLAENAIKQAAAATAAAQASAAGAAAKYQEEIAKKAALETQQVQLQTQLAAAQANETPNSKILLYAGLGIGLVITILIGVFLYKKYRK